MAAFLLSLVAHSMLFISLDPLGTQSNPHSSMGHPVLITLRTAPVQPSKPLPQRDSLPTEPSKDPLQAPPEKIPIRKNPQPTTLSEHSAAQHQVTSSLVSEILPPAAPPPRRAEAAKDQEIKRESTPDLGRPVNQVSEPVKTRQLASGIRADRSTVESTSLQKKENPTSQKPTHQNGSGFEPARFLNLTQPAYPHREKNKGHEGSVLLQIHISARGKIEEIEIAQSSGHPRLDSISQKAVRRAKLIPAKKNGKPISSIKSLRFTYRLD